MMTDSFTMTSMLRVYVCVKLLLSFLNAVCSCGVLRESMLAAGNTLSVSSLTQSQQLFHLMTVILQYVNTMSVVP